MHQMERQRPHWSDAVGHPLRSLNTLRYLHVSQIVNRAVRTVDPLTAIPPAHAAVLLPRPPVRPAEEPAGVFDGASFSFLNRRLLFGGSDRWHPPGGDALWIYNLHYFRYIWGLAPAAAERLVSDWMAANTAPRAAAWQPYPISIRVREWIEWLLAHRAAPEAFRHAMAGSISQQTDALAGQLEFHLMGNHLLENAITLCWAGLSFAGTRAHAWTEQGLTVLRQQLGQQVLADGVHDERSPMYQALLTEATLRLGGVARRSARVEAREIRTLATAAGRAMLRSLERMVHPDGGYALLNDAALGVAPSLASLQARFGAAGKEEEMGRGAWALERGGYCGYDNDGQYVIFDNGPIGPDHQPGHGHADTLSFELSHRHRRVITDTGVITYNAGRARQYDRSTAAHNTIEIDSRDQCELWGSFRCARRPSVTRASLEQTREGGVLGGGYRGPGRGVRTVSHTRQLSVTPWLLSATDRVVAAGRRRATLRLHLAPGLRVRRAPRGWTIEETPRAPVATLVGDGLEWSESRSVYHPEFGCEIERTCLAAHARFRDALALKWWLILK
jgi:Heparinase II/III-like protein/Heparinase II/III N-terminus